MLDCDQTEPFELLDDEITGLHEVSYLPSYEEVHALTDRRGMTIEYYEPNAEPHDPWLVVKSSGGRVATYCEVHDLETLNAMLSQVVSPCPHSRCPRCFHIVTSPFRPFKNLKCPRCSMDGRGWVSMQWQEVRCTS